MKRRGALVIAGIIAIGAAINFLQSGLHRTAGPQWQQESMTYLPQGERIKPALLGFETTVAHYLWIRTIIYFGGHLMTDDKYPWLIDMLDIITRLCPWFFPAYEFAGIMVPDVCHNPEAARIILERGLTYLGAKKFNIAFTMGMVHYRYYDDRKTAAHYIARAAMAADAPREKLAPMANAFFTKAGSPAEGFRVLLFAYETSDNPDVRRHLAKKIEELRRDVQHGNGVN
ncbi:MAG: hypothetical protein JW913_16410 [Chitinispirillaceae bacterium]|nr:hypothetical protein [Chitinispirillaceae bacterium]